MTKAIIAFGGILWIVVASAVMAFMHLSGAVYWLVDGLSIIGLIMVFSRMGETESFYLANMLAWAIVILPVVLVGLALLAMINKGGFL